MNTRGKSWPAFFKEELWKDSIVKHARAKAVWDGWPPRKSFSLRA